MNVYRNICVTSWLTNGEICWTQIPHQYMCWCDDLTKEGKFHKHYYIELSKQMRLNTIKKYDPTAHIEGRKGSQQDAIDYIMHPNKPGKSNQHEDGVRRLQGQRMDLLEAKKAAMTGGMRAILGQEVECNGQAIRVVEKMLTYLEPQRNWEMSVIWIWGKSESGKSRLAKEIGDEYFTKEQTYWKSDGNRWWDGYDQHTYVIIDEFRSTWWDAGYMLSLLDRYPKRVEYKGGYRSFLARCVAITSIFPPERIMQAWNEPKEQLLRRITEVICLDPKEEKIISIPIELAFDSVT
nr:MAG: replication associated protein [Arizlama virus]